MAGLAGNISSDLASGEGLISALLGSNLVDFWDVRAGANSVNWLGVRTAVPLIGVGTPPLTQDGILYAGQPVFVFNGVDQAFDSGDLSFDLAANATLPYAWCVGRQITAPGGTRSIVRMSLTLGGVHLMLGDSDGSGTTDAFYDGSITLGAVAVPQARPSFWEFFYDVGGPRTFVRDGVVQAVGAIGNIASAIRRVQVGGTPSAGSQFCSSSVSQVGLCKAVPTLSQRSLLRGAAQAAWQF